ncbi:MAG: hypothetical protein ACLGIP_04420, partial [Alphaproteobacteria bacterium]
MIPRRLSRDSGAGSGFWIPDQSFCVAGAVSVGAVCAGAVSAGASVWVSAAGASAAGAGASFVSTLIDVLPPAGAAAS